MTPNNQELVDRLAAEYVLGTLRGPARRRFERWRIASTTVDARCRLWEERLLPLARGLTPVRPPPRVWDGISRRLRLRSAARRRVFTWTQALAAGILVVTGGALLYWEAPVPMTQQATIATPADAPGIAGQPAWTVEVHAARLRQAQLVIRTAALPPHPAGHDYELWALPAGGKPVSLGVLPSTDGVSRRVLATAQLRALGESAKLAVSLEPTGGSPTGAPTGKVVQTVNLQTLTLT